MKEIDFIQAYYDAVSLAYTASTWWLTISTALVVATYFAGKHIPSWLFAVSLVLYALTATSAIFEIMGYSALGEHYAQSIATTLPGWEGTSTRAHLAAHLDSAVNYAFFILGSISAAAYSFVTWRGARKATASGTPVPAPDALAGKAAMALNPPVSA